MKKFVGSVNGKSFDNEEEFKAAAKNAIKENDGMVSISSYYSYGNDEEKKEEEEDDSNYVNTNEYFLGDRKPDTVTDDGSVVEYNIDEDLVNRIRQSINKDSIKKKLEYQTNCLSDDITRYENRILSVQTDIDSLKKKIEINNDLIKTLEKSKNGLRGKYKYYANLLERICADEEAKEEKKEEKEEVVEESKPTFEDVLKSFGAMSLYDIFKKNGFIS
jgi:hypothetical protein